MKLTRLFIIVFIFTQCGIPSNELFDDLNSPKNLTFISKTNDGIEINFWAYNPETSFTGYNIYMTTESEAKLTTQHTLHIVDSKINDSISRYYIVKNNASGGYPTITDSDLGVIAARSAPTSITFIFDKAPNNQVIGAASYYIAISAYSSTSNLESNLSNVIRVDP